MLDTRVSLRITSKKRSLGEIASLIGNPTRGFSLGDVCGGERPCEFTLWSYESSKARCEVLSVHIGELLDFLDLKYAPVSSMMTDCEMDLFCMLASDNGQGGAELPAHLLRRLAGYNIGIVLDIYAETDACANA